TACLSNVKQMSVAMNIYANDMKNWYPVMPVSLAGGSPPPIDTANLFSRQWKYGGVAGLFSLRQIGDGTDVGYGAAFPTGLAYDNGNREPLLASYIDGLAVLNCPADQEDRHWPVTQDPGARTYNNGRPKIVQKIGKREDVVQYWISYLYISGLRPDEPTIPFAVPIWGDDTNAVDIGPKAFWGGGQHTEIQPQGRQGFYNKVDNHKDAGANFAYSDGHATFVKGNAASLFFTPFLPNPADPANPIPNPNAINVIDPARNDRVQTID
ncbi:MAG: hypothetical protein KF768_09710, partial [Phycisphaeraceae bacterium]|nr:hypothetical protein [Phycisphaeraceae bacterium]